MAERKNSTTKQAPSKNRQFHEDRNIPTIKVDIPMPKGAKPPRRVRGSRLEKDIFAGSEL